MAKTGKVPDIYVDRDGVPVLIDVSTPDGRLKREELKAAAVRLRNGGATVARIADILRLEPDVAEWLLNHALNELAFPESHEVRGRQQATVNDMRRVLYPGVLAGDHAAMDRMVKVMDHEAKLHPGTYAPQRVAVGMDQETFETTVAQDLKEIGVDPKSRRPVIDSTPDDGWANT